MFLKSMQPAFAVLHPALVEHLEEDLVHVGVRLLDLVEQHDAVRPAAHGLGQHAAFAVADVAGRRALERGDGVRLLELAHVDRDDVLLAAVERFGERSAVSVLPTPDGPHSMNTPIGLFGLSSSAREVWMRLAIISSAWCWPITRWLSVSASFSTRLDLVLDHAADRNAGPVRDDRRDRLLVDARQDQRRLALQRRRASPAARRARRAAAAHARSGGRRGVAGGVRGRLLRVAPPASSLLPVPSTRSPPLPQLGADRRGCDRRARFSAFQRCFELARGASRSSRAFRSSPLRALGRVDADGLFAADDLELGLQRLDRRGGSPRARAGTACWLMATRAHAVSSRLTALSGSWRAGNVAVRQPHRRLERLVEHLHAVVLLEHRGDAAHHQDRLVLARLGDLHDLEAAGQRRILLDVLLVFGPGGRGDRAQRAARQRRLEQVGRVAGARPRRRRRSACAPRR